MTKTPESRYQISLKDESTYAKNQYHGAARVDYDSTDHLGREQTLELTYFTVADVFHVLDNLIISVV